MLLNPTQGSTQLMGSKKPREHSPWFLHWPECNSTKKPTPLTFHLPPAWSPWKWHFHLRKRTSFSQNHEIILSSVTLNLRQHKLFKRKDICRRSSAKDACNQSDVVKPTRSLARDRQGPVSKIPRCCPTEVGSCENFFLFSFVLVANAFSSDATCNKRTFFHLHVSDCVRNHVEWRTETNVRLCQWAKICFCTQLRQNSHKSKVCPFKLVFDQKSAKQPFGGSLVNGSEFAVGPRGLWKTRF